MARKKKSDLIEYLSHSSVWKQGYKTYHRVMGKPLGWLFHHKDDEPSIWRIDRRNCCDMYSDNGNSFQVTCPQFIRDYCSIALQHTNVGDVKVFRCYKNKRCLLVKMPKGTERGFVVFCAIKGHQKTLKEKAKCFYPFLHSEINSFKKVYDLKHLYETMQPRSIALSSLHSVNRAISSTVSMDELIPKIGRLCSQILKARFCAIYLVDKKSKWLEPRFIIGSKTDEEQKKRYIFGKGPFGAVARTGEFHITKGMIVAPLIDDDVMGLIVLKHKLIKSGFNRSDIEVLKALSEQAVVAIRNSRLLEEHERITVGSIKSINNILDIHLPKGRVYSHIFDELVFALASKLGLAEVEINKVQRAASLLDAGHLGIPDSIRQKKGKLSKKEFDIIKAHPYRGVEIIKSIDSLKPVIPIILHHHENFDGSGYPDGLKGDKIPIGARIISVVVAFTAMLRKKAYKRKKSVVEALDEILSHAGTQFDPVVSKTFVELMNDKQMLNLVRSSEYGTKSRN